MNKSLWLASAGLAALTAAPAFAQSGGQIDPTTQNSPTAKSGSVSTTGTAQTPVDSGDIIVTATRRNEALSDVPLAVSAVTAETMRNSGASDIRQLQQVSPSLLVSSTQSEGGASTARIRGIGTVGDNPGLESSVGVFIDGVYRSRVGAGLTELGAIDRVEVLRGPQGTLFGRNTSAGLISIITAKPKFQDEFTGAATIGNYNMRRLEGSVNGALSDSVAARVDGVYMKRDGFLKDLISGRDVNDRNRWLLRGQLLYQPSSDLSVRLIADYSKRNEECCAAPYVPPSDAVRDSSGAVVRAPSTIVPLLNALGGIVPPDPFDRKVVISPGRSFRGDVKDWGVSGEINYKLGAAQLTSITAYRDNDLIRGTDVDYSNLDIVYRPDDGTAFNRFKTFSQEMRFQGTSGKLDWLIGGYYANEKLRSQDSLRYGRDYGALAACTGAALFAAQAGAPTLVSPTNPTCFQPLVATAIRDTPVTGLVAQYNAALAASNFAAASALGQQITALGAFARLNNAAIVAPGVPAVNFSGAPFVNNGFQNLGILQGVPFQFTDAGFVDDFRQKSNNFAVFTHNIFSITDRLKATIGLRYTSETKRLNANMTDNNIACRVFTSSTLLAQLPCINPSVPGGLMTLNGKKTENKLSGTAVLSYKPTDQLLTYVSYSRGYKAGGFNLDRSALARQNLIGQVCPTSGTLPTGCAGYASAANLEFKPEINNAFEAGFKYNGRGLDINVAVFHQLFRDFQLNTFNGQNFIVETINSCSNDLGGADTDNSRFTGACTGKVRSGVRSQGVEFEAFTRPMTDLGLNFGVTYADTKYRKNLVGADGRALTNALFQLPGRRLSNAALWTATASATYTPPIGSSGLRGLFYIDWRHQTNYNTGSDLDVEKIENGYHVFNGRIGLTGPDRSWAVELWANNLFNENVYQIAFDAFLQGSGTQRGVEQGFYNRSNQLYGVFLGEPRTYGLTLRGRIGGTRRAVPDYVAPPAPPPPPATQTCGDGSVIAADASCPVAAPPPPPPPPAPSKGERG